MGIPFSKVSEGGFIVKGWVSKDFILGEFPFGKGMRVLVR
jgi:hypothetical protein